MEYLIGSITTLVTTLLAIRLLNIEKTKIRIPKVKYSQSHTFEIMKPILVITRLLAKKEKVITQSTKHYDKQHVRVILSDQKAYWILNNIFYVADEQDGIINKETARAVDTMQMDKLQLEKMMAIVEALTEGEDDDSRDSGNKKL